MGKYSKIAVIMILSICTQLSAIALGSRIPEFILESGEKKILESQSLDGQIIFLFYDHKDYFKRNNDFKEELFNEYNKLSKAEQSMISIVQIIDCSESSFLNSYFYRKSLCRNSQKYGFTIWGDWEGKVKREFGFWQKGSYMLIVNTQGKVVYSDKEVFEMGKINQITGLLDKIFEKQHCRRR